MGPGTFPCAWPDVRIANGMHSTAATVHFIFVLQSFSTNRAKRDRHVRSVQLQSDIQFSFLAATFQVCGLLEVAGGRREEAVSSSLHGTHVEISLLIPCNHRHRRLFALLYILPQFNTSI